MFFKKKSCTAEFALSTVVPSSILSFMISSAASSRLCQNVALTSICLLCSELCYMYLVWRQEMCVSQFRVQFVADMSSFVFLSWRASSVCQVIFMHLLKKIIKLMFKMTPEHIVIISHFFSVPQASHHLDMNGSVVEHVALAGGCRQVAGG